ncbi:bifunctional 6-phosphofructo-2-kinase/fructose-2,6-bisphosphate 2-phosphatase [Hesseltinella vesiculosa]|uniref:Bifunctional 6-phosphofructo-2-kinase/fructose-2,6-bisphosphate 2-phosphatase n=1 Tax=Hesseltinella vesiculosa TaxID=101127 RepID=A0A1X2G3Y7_9FUNG|nr:bifunctional 6-phosphofructo-2-kinase/fructose-2,6-bisphosphate 2-phosphatase [Hesseltinella vesiculosa]
MDRRRKTLPVIKTDADIERMVEEHNLILPGANGQSPVSPSSSRTTSTRTASSTNQLSQSPPDDSSLVRPSPSKPVRPKETTASLLLPPAVPGRWIRLAEEEKPVFQRHSVGLTEIPGVVRTLKPPTYNPERQLETRLVIIMVGLPARGKSYIVKKLRRYLNWLQYETKVFNVGNTRRTQKASPSDQSAKFFDPDNNEMKKIRDDIAMDVLEHLIEWLKKGKQSRVAIHDATNSTISRRQLLIERLSNEPKIKILLLESICTDQTVLERNFRLKLLGPDYKNIDPVQALEDFRSRVANYERAYEPLGDWEEERDLEYCKLINVGKKVVAYNISGYLSGQCVFYLMNFNLSDRQIFVTRHGQSTDNLDDRIGGDASLTPLGRRFGKALERFISQQRKSFAMSMARRKQEQLEDAYGFDKLDLLDPSHDGEAREELLNKTAEALSSSQFTVWTSMLKRSMETAASFSPEDYDIKHIRYLNEINSGGRECMTYEEIQRLYPQEFKARQENKLYYRYPGMGGESYIDVIHRLQPLIIELERMTQSCLIITHRVVLRIILGYLLDWSREEMPHMLVPIHTVYEYRPKPYGSELKKWRYVEEKDTFEEF